MRRQFMVEVETSEEDIKENDAWPQLIWLLLAKHLTGGDGYDRDANTYISSVSVKEVK